MTSARALRDVNDLWGDEEPWPVDLTVCVKKPVKSSHPFARLAVVLLALVILLVVWLAPTVAVEGPVRSYLPSSDRLQGVIGKSILGLQTHRFREDFRSGLGEWFAGGGNAALSGWKVQAGTIRPGRLRLWTRSMDMADYQFEFEGQIERKAMSWAFRAQDRANYYGTKLTAAKSGAAADGRIMRLVMRNGVLVHKELLPSPVPIFEHIAYHVRVSVKGNRFNTLVDGQLVDTWTDSRFHSGGVGFFSDQGEMAAVRSVSITDRESLLDRIFASFLLLAPGDLPERP